MLSDFGLAYHGECISNGKYKSEHVYTYMYRPPEVFYGGNYGYPADVWATAATITEMFIEEFCFGVYGLIPEDKMIHAISKSFGDINELTWPGVTSLPKYNMYTRTTTPAKKFEDNRPLLGDQMYDLLEKMLQLDPSKRLTAYQALYHPVFDSIRANDIPEMGPCMANATLKPYPKFNRSTGKLSRIALINTLFLVGSHHFGFNIDTLFHGIYLADTISGEEKDYVACLSIAAKLRETNVSLYEIYEYYFETDKDNQIAIETEIEDTILLGFNLYLDTPFDLLLAYCEYYPEDIQRFVKYLYFMFMYSEFTIDKPGRSIAAACLYIACKVYNVNFKHDLLLDSEAEALINHMIYEFLDTLSDDLNIISDMKDDIGFNAKGIKQLYEQADTPVETAPEDLAGAPI
jgi:serine/threonine protein kinase